jgi:hypothetical protein
MKINRLLASVGLGAAMVLVGCSTVPEQSTTPEPPVSEEPGSEAPASETPVQSTSRSFQTEISPNVYLDVQTEAGTCPETVGLWEFLLGFEGGADHTVVVDTGAIASLPTQIIQQEDRRIIYEAPLQDQYASCVGTAHSDRLSMYSIYFESGKILFDLNMTEDDGFREIRYADVSAGRPYVHWRAAE